MLNWGKVKITLMCAALGCCLLMGGCGGSGESVLQSDSSAPAEVTSQTEVSSAPEENSVSDEGASTTASTAQTTQSEAAESKADESDVVIELDDTYAEMVMDYDNSYLGLPRMDKVYVFQSTGESAEIGGSKCYAVSCYDENEGTLYYMCDFYITEDGSAVYRYYLSDDKYVLLPESKEFVQMDPTTQTAEEIFAAANELYGYFDMASLDGDSECRIEAEVNGSMWIYQRVIDERLNTKAKLLNALSCYFSTDIINSLMDTSVYREGEDGMLYSTGGARGANIYYQYSVYELVELTEDTAVFKCYATYGDEELEGENTRTDEYTYNAAKQDGRWVFTNFKLPY